MKAITKTLTIFSAVLVSVAASASFGACKQNTTRTGRHAYTVAPSSVKVAATSQVQQAAVKSNSAVR